MSTVDDRVVGLKFNKEQFLSGVTTTLSALGKLKAALKLDGAKKGLDDLQTSGSKFNLSNIGAGVEALGSKFSALSVIGITALATITQKAVSAGLQIAKSLTIEPIKQGFDEYNTNLGAIQTVLANTQSAGTNLKDVNGALAELNTYSDKTIYNFGEMAKNIGTFTAAGVDLKTSTQSIKGIANLAALSGSNSEQASTAMYQLSQAIASGKVGLQDWNSVVNAGMGGSVFQKALTQTAVKMGTLDGNAVKLTGKMKNVTVAGNSFRDSLSDPATKGWLSSEVLTSTLNQFTGDMSDAELAAKGFSKTEIEEVKKQAKAALEAATVVKTLPQLMDTLKEAVGSGWSQSFQLIFGDFEQAKKLFTGVNRAISPIISNSSAARNKILKDWQKLGGRNAAIEGISQGFMALTQIVQPITKAFHDMFPQDMGVALANFSKAFQGVMTRFQNFTAKNGPQVYRIFRGIFAVLDIGRMIIMGVFSVIGKLFGAVFGGTGSFLELAARVGDFLFNMREVIKSGGGIQKFFDVLGTVVATPVKWIGMLIGLLVDFLSSLGGLKAANLGSTIGRVEGALNPLAHLGDIVMKAWSGAVALFSSLSGFFAPIGTALANLIGALGTSFADAITTGDFSGVLDIINTGLLGGILLLIKKFVSGGVKIDVGGGFLGQFKEIMEGVTGTMEAMQTQLKAKALLDIAIAIGILAASLFVISTIDSAALTKALGAITAMFLQLAGAMALLNKIPVTEYAKLPAIGLALIALSVGILILSAAVKVLSTMDWDELAKGIGGVGVLLFALSKYSKAMSGVGTKGIFTSSAAMVVLAAALLVMSKAVKSFGSLDWKTLVKGLLSVGALLKGLALFNEMNTVNKGALASSVGIIALGIGLNIMATAVSKLGKLNVPTLAKGLLSMSLLLEMLGTFTKVSGGPGFIITAAAVVILAKGLEILAGVLQKMGKMSWVEIAKSMVTLAASLAIIAGGLYLMEAALPGSAALIVAAAALRVLMPVLQDMGKLKWGEIAKIVVGLAGVLIILAVGLTAMIAALPGAAALVVASGALAILQPVLQAFGEMSWGTILSGLGALALTLAVLGVAGILLLPAIPGLIGLGIAITLLGAAVLLAGVGVLAFATGLTALSVAGTVGAAGITVLVTSILNLLPLAMTKLAEGIVAFAKVIGDAGPTFVVAMTTLIVSLLTAIDTVAPKIVTTLVNLINLLLNKLGASLPDWVTKGMALLTKLLEGVGKKLPDLITAGANIIVKLIKGIGDNASKISDAAADTIVKFINGIADAIDKHAEDFRAAGRKLAKSIIDGLTGGLATKVSDAVGAAVQAGKDLIGGLMDGTDSHSPSRAAYKVGGFVMDGLENNLNDRRSGVGQTAADVGEHAISTMKKAMLGVSNIMDDGITTPTIRPVLDLSAIRSGAAGVGGLFGSPKIDLDPTRTSAQNAASAYQDNLEARKTDVASTSTVTREVTYNQYNNSPKALSPVDIYRNTKNIVSAAKDDLDK